MKLVYVTDTHFTMRTPRSRRDDYPQAILRKFAEVLELARSVEADAVIHGGDLFDTPRVSPRLVGEIAAMLRAFPIPFYCVLGNHDTFGQNPDTWPQTELGILVRAGLVRLLDREHPITQESGILIAGQPYRPGIDPDPQAYALDADGLRILAAHGMLVKDAPPDIVYTPLDEVPGPNEGGPHVILVGHFHPGFVETTRNQTLVINPGALARTDAGLDNLNRQVQVAVLTVNPGAKRPVRYELVRVRSAAPAAEILTREHLDLRRAQQRAMLAFHDRLQHLARSVGHFDEALQRLLVAVDEPVRQSVQAALEQAQLEEAESKHTEIETHPVPLAYVELTDFQSHRKTRLDLARHLNAIVGPSDQGKSAILRAIWWALYNEPKGKDAEAAIRTGSDAMSVELGYVSGARVIRRRQKGKGGAGEYLLHLPEGDADDITSEKVQRFTGFGDTPPPEILAVTGAIPVTIARDVRRVVNFHRQHDAYFLLSETPSVQASALAYLAGAHRGDAAVRILGAEQQQLRRTIKSRQADLADVEQALLAYVDLEQEKQALEAMQQQLARARALAEEIKALRALADELARVEKTERQAAEALERLAWVETAERRLEEAAKALARYQHLAELGRRARELSEQIDKARRRLASLEPVEAMAEKLHQAEHAFGVWQRLVDLRDRYETMRAQYVAAKRKVASTEWVDEASPVLQRAEATLQVLRELRRIQAPYEQLRLRFAEARERYKAAQREIEQAERELRLLWAQQQICPVCERPLSADDIHRLSSVAS